MRCAQVAGGVLLLHLTGHLNFLLGKSEFNHDTCTFKPLADVHSPHDLCGALSALALASVLAWFLIQLLKVGLLLAPCASMGQCLRPKFSRCVSGSRSDTKLGGRTYKG